MESYLVVLLLAVSCVAAEQNPCLFDGFQYQKGEIINIQHCLGQMTCLGDNLYTDPILLGGVCPSSQTRAAVDGQSGCLFDGFTYAPQETIVISHCLAKMTCLGANNYSGITLLHGICDSQKRAVDGQSGCLFDGKVLGVGETITVGTATLQCLGHNLYNEVLHI